MSFRCLTVSFLFLVLTYSASSDPHSMAFTKEVDPVVFSICQCLESVVNTPDGRQAALHDVLSTINDAGSDFQYDVRNELNVIRELPVWSVFIRNVQRLEYLVDQVQYYHQNEMSVGEKMELADTLLDPNADGLWYILFNIHGSILASGVSSSSSIYSVYNNRRKSVSSNYMEETIEFAVELINLQTYGYTAGILACTIKNNSSCFDRFTSALTNRLEEQDLYLSRKRVNAFSAPNIQTSFNWCSCSTCKPLLGDFNGDGSTDVLCFKSGSFSRLTTFDDNTGTFRNQNNRWNNAGGSCQGGDISVGFYNGDRRSDVLCLKPSDRNKIRMVYTTTSGYLSSSTGWTGNHNYVTRCFSNVGNSAIYTGDFNGDRKTDIMCQNHVSGDMSITNRPTHHILGTWRWVLPWCRTATTEMFVGDFNGDQREDLLCQDWQNGGSSIKLASTRGTFMSNVAWRGLAGFCPQFSRRTLYVGDFNGDRKSDLLCYTQRQNSRDTFKIAYANKNGNFENSQIVVINFNWCSSPEIRLRNVADVNGDGRDDLVCYDQNNQMRVSLNEVYLYFGE